jgi:hypothetical protein
LSGAWNLLAITTVEGNAMKNLLKIGSFLAPLVFFSIAPAFAQTEEQNYYRQWVDNQDGEITVNFDSLPMDLALHAFRVKTGFQIDVPSTTETKLLNLRLNRSPLEPAVRSLISTIGFQNFALMYDETGRPSRAVVLGAQIDAPRRAINFDVANQSTEPAVQPLTVEEQDKLQTNLDRWNELKKEERGRIEDRLKSLPASDEREQLISEFGRQVLGIKK